MDIVNILLDKLQDWGTNTISILPNLVAALVIFFVFKWIGKMVRKGVIKILSRTKLAQTIQMLIGLALQVLIVFAGLLIALSVLNLDKTVTSVLAGLGLVGLALGYAFQDIIANFVSGILISINKVIHIGDFIEADGKQGEVIATSLRTTTLITPQGQHVLIPNSAIFENTMTNFSVSGKRRVDIACGVAYSSDLEKVERVTREVVENLAARNTVEPVGFTYTEFGDSAINFTTNFWIAQTDAKHFFGAQNEAIKAIKARFDKEGFDIPFPIRTIVNK